MAMVEALAVALGGALGALGRYGAEMLRLWPERPWLTTMTVNIAGSLLIGLLWVWLSRPGTPQPLTRLLMTGVLGGFTTYSTFALDSLKLLEGGRWAVAALYVAATLLLALGACALGAYTMRRFLS